jgi:hypothetical protein
MRQLHPAVMVLVFVGCVSPAMEESEVEDSKSSEEVAADTGAALEDAPVVPDAPVVDSVVDSEVIVDSVVADSVAPPPADAGPPTANHLYVATTGLDSNPGTKEKPFLTILKASQVAVPDTTVHVAAGTYVGGFRTLKNGTATKRILYVSDVRWGAKIVPPKSSSSTAGWDNRGAYVTIDGFEVDGSVDPTSGTKWNVGINVGGAGDIVMNCHAHHIFRSGTGSSQGGAGILLDAWYGFNDMQALGNVVHHVGPTTGGHWYQGIYQTATGVIENNVVYAVTGGGIHLWHDAHHIDIANNTTFGNGIGIIVGGGDFVRTTGPCDYVTVSNNIAYDNASIGIDEEGIVGTHNVFTHNLSFKNVTNWRLKVSAHTNDVTADPLFVMYARSGGGDYRLRMGSPAIDAGTTKYAPGRDHDGLLRPYGAAIDIGAYEWRP